MGQNKRENRELHFPKGFGDAYAIRLGALLPSKGIKSSTPWYNALYTILSPFFPLMKMLPSVITSEQFGKAMINSVRFPLEEKYLDNKAMKVLSAKH